MKTFIRFNLSPFVVENKQRKREHVYIKDEMKGITVGFKMKFELLLSEKYVVFILIVFLNYSFSITVVLRQKKIFATSKSNF